MAEQLQCLGFDFDTPEALERFFADYWDKKTLVDLADGVYLRLDVTPAISCWLSVDPEDQSLLDWDIHCDDNHRLPCSFDGSLACDDRGQSGMIHLMLNPGEDDIPIVAACPALALWPQREEGSPGLVSLAFYAESLAAEAEMTDTLAADELDSMAAISGTVTAAESCRNPWSGTWYQHLTLDCRGLSLSLYCTESMMPRMPEKGTRVSARCFVTCLAEAGVISTPKGDL